MGRGGCLFVLFVHREELLMALRVIYVYQGRNMSEFMTMDIYVHFQINQRISTYTSNYTHKICKKQQANNQK